MIEKDPYYGSDKGKFAIRYSEIDFDDYLVLDRWGIPIQCISVFVCEEYRKELVQG